MCVCNPGVASSDPQARWQGTDCHTTRCEPPARRTTHRMWMCGARQGVALSFFAPGWLMAFASIRDSMLMISGSRWHRDRGTTRMRRGESSLPVDVTGGAASERLWQTRGGICAERGMRPHGCEHGRGCPPRFFFFDLCFFGKHSCMLVGLLNCDSMFSGKENNRRSCGGTQSFFTALRVPPRHLR